MGEPETPDIPAQPAPGPDGPEIPPLRTPMPGEQPVPGRPDSDPQPEKLSARLLGDDLDQGKANAPDLPAKPVPPNDPGVPDTSHPPTKERID